MSYLVPFSSCVFSPFSIAITTLEEERANLGAFRTFDRFVFVWICRLPLPLGVWEGFVILALPGLFSYLFYYLVLFVLVLLFFQSSSSRCLGGTAVCDCGTPWAFLLPLFLNNFHARNLQLGMLLTQT